MKSATVKLDYRLDEETKRIVGFASAEIVDVEFTEDTIRFTVHDEADPQTVGRRIQRLIEAERKGRGSEEEVLYERRTRASFLDMEQLLASGLVRSWGEGLLSLNGPALRLYHFLDERFVELLREYDPKLRKYPVLLPVPTYARTKYLSTSPQYAMFCSPVKESVYDLAPLPSRIAQGDIRDLLGTPAFALSPSACFHLYEELRDAALMEPSVYSFRQNVFRNEGRLNWKELYRLRDYTVREVVFIGDESYVHTVREDLLQKVLSLLDRIGLDYAVKVASDPFIVPEMQKYKEIQRRSRIKYELRIPVGVSTEVSCASFNLHGSSFSSSFNFTVEGAEHTVSGCIGFGLERLVLAFLAQFGCDPGRWPDEVKQAMEENAMGRLSKQV